MIHLNTERECRYCLGLEHPSGTMCPLHPDFIPPERITISIQHFRKLADLAAKAVFTNHPETQHASDGFCKVCGINLDAHAIGCQSGEGKRNTFREALEALAGKMEERCGDHCSNNCKICEYRNDLRLILARTARGAE